MLLQLRRCALQSSRLFLLLYQSSLSYALGCAGPALERPAVTVTPRFESFSTELEAVATMREQFVTLGYVEARDARFSVLEDVLIPMHVPRRGILVGRFLQSDSVLRAQLEKLFHGVGTTFETAAVRAGNSRALIDQWRLFLLVSLSHELTHFLRTARHRPTMQPSMQEERVAMDVEIAFLQRSIAQGEFSAEALVHYDRFQQVLWDAVPADVQALLTEHPEQHDALFAEHYPLHLQGFREATRGGRENPHLRSSQVVMGLYTLHRRTQRARPPRALPELLQEVLGAPGGT